MLHVGVVALGVMDPDRAAGFWQQALNYRLMPGGFGGWSRVLEPIDGTGVRIALQASETQPPSHPRIHLDLHVADVTEQQREVERLVDLGAEHVAWDDYPDDPDFVVLADTEGNRFCIVDLTHPQ